MVNFRFHLVSLVAVFLALAIGILMGSTVIDQATVKTLKTQLSTIKDQKQSRDRRISALETELGRWHDFADAGAKSLLRGTLADVPVMVVATKGVNGDVVAAVHDSLRQAGAADEGTLWLTPRLSSSSTKDVSDLAAVLGDPPATGAPITADTVRAKALQSLASALSPSAEPTAAVVPGAANPAAATTSTSSTEPPTTAPGATTTTTVLPPTGGALLQALVQRGFLEYGAPDGTKPDLTKLPATGTRLVVVSGQGSKVPDGAVAVPLVTQLVQRAGAEVVAAEAGNDNPGGRAVFVGELRKNGDIRQKLSTVDDLETFSGRVALVLAVGDLGSGKFGAYGVGSGTKALPTPGK